jgi:hypothetical protein
MKLNKDISFVITLLLVAVLSSSSFTLKVTTFCYSARKVSNTQLLFGIPSFLEPKKQNNDSDNNTKITTKTTKPTTPNKEDITPLEKKSVGLQGILQLIAAGAGAPFLGDYQGIDKETGKFMFSLEANNLVDEKGNSKQTQMPYFENGWVDENDKGFQWPWEKKT